MHQLTGLGVTAISIDELIAEGPTHVVVVATNSGTNVHNTPWTMTALELVDVVNGKITKKRTALIAWHPLQATEAHRPPPPAGLDTSAGYVHGNDTLALRRAPPVPRPHAAHQRAGEAAAFSPRAPSPHGPARPDSERPGTPSS